MSTPIKNYTPDSSARWICSLCRSDVLPYGKEHNCLVEAQIRSIVRQELAERAAPAGIISDDAAYARRYKILRDYITPRELYDHMIMRRPELGPWKDLRSDQSVRDKINELCDAVGEEQ